MDKFCVITALNLGNGEDDMNTHWPKFAIVPLVLGGLSTMAFADNPDALQDKDNLYTNAGFLVGGMSSQSDNGTGGTSTTSFYMVGFDGSFGFDNVFPFGKYLNVQGSMLVGADSSGDTGVGAIGAGIGAHAEFEPVVGNVDIGKISGFVSALENYDSVSVTLPTYSYGGQTYGGGTESFHSSSGSIQYGVKWLILNVYEWDFYGVNGSSSSSSGQNSPIGGNSINLKFKWLMEPKRNSPYLGAYLSHQSQNGSTSDLFMIIGGYVW